MRNQILTAGFILAALASWAQNETDAFLATGLEYSGTARFVAMGSSMGALGGDPSALSINPASIGVYRFSEFTLTPSFIGSKTDANYYGTNASERDLNVALSNGAYIQVREANTSKWKNVQFGISNTRLKDFHQDYQVKGRHNDSSLLEFITNNTNSQSLDPNTGELENYDPFYAYPAYFTFLINPYVDGQGYFYLDTLTDGLELDQTADVRYRGRIGEMIYAGGANYDDRLYIGGAIGFVRMVRDEELTFTEAVVDTSMSTLDYYVLNEDIEIRGTGFNFKLGAIYRVADMLRVGASYHSPTWYGLSTEWYTDIESRFKDGSIYTFGTNEGGYNEYRLRTPSRLIASVGLVVGKQGLLNVEYEYLDFSGAELNSNRNFSLDFEDANSQVRRQYTDVGNIRAGGEFKYKNMSLRGGFGYYPSPYEKAFTLSESDKMMYSGGIGWRKDNVNIDFAYRLTESSSDYYPYSPDLVDPALLEHKSHSVLATFGVRF